MKTVIISGYEFIFDDDINTCNLCAGKHKTTGYVILTYSSGPHRPKVFSRVLMEAPSHMEVDHIDRNEFNNTRENLRIVTHQENSFNRSGWKNRKHDLPKGVFKMRNMYQAKIKVDGKSIFLGTFMYPEDAEEAYKEASIKYHANPVHGTI